MLNKDFEPKLLTLMKKGYSWKAFQGDAIAGIIVGIVALPLAIAFAIASGVKPEQGLYTAIIAGFIVAALGGSRVQVSGPTGAFIVVVYSIVAKFGYNGLAVATLMAGIILIIMGLTRMGAFLKYIPYPVIVGFTTGIAVIIFSSQVKDFFGLSIEKVPADFIEKWSVYFEHFSSLNFIALVVGLVSIFIIIFFQKYLPRIPGTLVSILGVTVVVQLFNIPVETIGSRFGSVPNSLPALSFPDLSWAQIQLLISPAITIALLGAIETLLSAVVADGMIGTRHKSNMELVALGIGNIFSPLFSGIPATGAIARTATNVKNGGRTPVSSIIHALTLFLILIYLGQYAAKIPMATLAAILIIVAYNMSELDRFHKLLKSPKSDVAVLVTTFLLTILVDLTVAIEIGVLLASVMFIKRMTEVTQASFLSKELNNSDNENMEDSLDSVLQKIPKEVEVFELQGALFFGAIDSFREAIKFIEKRPKILILRMRNVVAIDASGINSLEELYDSFKKDGIVLLISGIHSQPLFAIQKSGLIDRMGIDNIVGNLNEAILKSEEILNKTETHH